ncbi:MAG: DUF1002 domain-containing protein [Lachnospiraceae bacterium]|nr:DUF1002 domain-containing protein [Lachnospiraceae bacterium]
MKFNYFFKTSLVLALAMSFLIGYIPANSTVAKADAEYGDTMVTLGSDLNADERKTVLGLLELTEDDLKTMTVLGITNQDEHDYLDDYLPASVIGTRALSSIKLVKAEDGTGIKVTTKNISYCTDAMYVNALATAGIKDAYVTVVGPFSISGTAALVGTMKAYEEMTGEDISEDVKDAATNELVVTGEIAEMIGDSDKASELMGYVKNEVLENKLKDEDEIRKVIEEASDEMGVTLTDDEVESIISIMKKLGGLDIDLNSIKDQAKGLYDKLEGLDIDTEKAEGVWNNIVSFFKGIYDKIINAFS